MTSTRTHYLFSVLSFKEGCLARRTDSIMKTRSWYPKNENSTTAPHNKLTILKTKIKNKNG
jgi:hypothetical protein